MKILTATAIAASLLMAQPVDADAKYRGSYRSHYSRPAAPKPAPVQSRPQPQQPPTPAGGSLLPSVLGTAAGVAAGAVIGDALTSDPAAPCYDDNGNARPCASTPAAQ